MPMAEYEKRREYVVANVFSGKSAMGNGNHFRGGCLQ